MVLFPLRLLPLQPLLRLLGGFLRTCPSSEGPAEGGKARLLPRGLGLRFEIKTAGLWTWAQPA